MDTKTISKQAKKAVAIGLCASLVGGVAAPVLSTTHVAYAAVAGKPQVNTMHDSVIQFKDQALKERILSEMKGQKIIALDAHDITETDALKVENLNLSINKYLGDTSLSLENIDKFKNLKSLDLTGNKLPSIKPLIKLPQLSKLYLAERSFGADFYRQRGCLYNEDTLLSLKLLPALKELTVRTNTITPLAGLTNLTSLFIRGNQITDLTPLKGLTNLTRLAVPNNQISDLKPLAGLTNLTFVDLHDNQISDITPLKGLTNLTTLYLNHNKITDIKPLAGLTHLTELRLSGCYDVTFDFPNSISDISPLHDLKKLKLLNLKDNQITDIKPLAGLSNLTELTLSCNQIVDFSLLKNKNIKNLSTSPQVFVIKAATRDIVVNKEVSTNGRVGELIDFGSSYATFNPTTNKLALKEIPKETTLQGKGKYHLIRYKSIKDESSSIFMPNYAFYVDFTPYINSLKERVKASGAPEEEQQKIIEKMNSGTLTVEQFEKDIAELTRKAKFHDQTIQTEDMSAALAALLKDADNIKACANYNNADDNLKQAYDTAITDGQKVYNKLSSTPEQVQQACAQIKAAFSKLNGDAKASTTASQLQNRIQQLEQELEQAKQQGTADKATIERITNAIQQTKQQLEQLKQDKTKSDTEKQQEIDKLNNQIEDLNKQIIQLANDKKTLSEQLQQAQSNLADVQKKLQTATEHGAADKSKIEELNGQISTLNGQLEQLKQDKTKSDEQKQQEIAKLNGQITNLGKQIEQLTQENTTLKGQVASLQEQLGKLQGQLQSAQQQGVADKATIERLTGQVASLSSQLEALKADKTKSDQEKQQEIERLTAQLHDLTSQVNILTKDKNSLQQQLDAATGKVSALTSELEQLKAAKKQADEKNEQTIAGLNSQIAQLGKDKQGLQEQINTKQAEISKLQGQIQTLKDDHSKSDTEKQKKIEQLTAQLAALTQEKQGLQGKLDAANEKISTLTQQLQQAQSRADADTKQLQELTIALQQAKQQLEQLKSDKTKSGEQKQQEIDTLNAKIAELEKKVQTCSAQAVGGAIVAPLVNEKPTFDIEKYKREHNYMLPGIAAHTYQIKQDTFTSDVHAALQQLAPMAASTDAAAQATAQRTDESERAQAEQKADTSSKQEADKTKLDQNKFPQTGDNSLIALVGTFAGAFILALGCFVRKKSSKANKR